MISAFCRSFSDAVVARKCRFIPHRSFVHIRPCMNLAGKDKSRTSSPQWTDHRTLFYQLPFALSLRGRKQELGSRLIRTRDHPTDRRPRQTAMVISRDSLSRRRKGGGTEGRVVNGAALTQPPSKRSARAKRKEGRKGIIIGSQAAAMPGS